MTLGTTWTNKDKNVASLEDLMPLIRQQLTDGKSVSFIPTGISMQPLFSHNRDVVVISPVDNELKMYDIVLYQRENGDYVLHRVVGINKDTGAGSVYLTYNMLGDNQFVKEYGIRHSQIIGVVTRFSRDGNEHSIEEVGYKMYCRMWYRSRHFRHFFLRVQRKIKRLIG